MINEDELLEKLRMNIAISNFKNDIKQEESINEYTLKNKKFWRIYEMKKRIVAFGTICLMLVSGVVFAANNEKIVQFFRGLGGGIDSAVENGYIENVDMESIAKDTTIEENENFVENIEVSAKVEDFLMDDYNLSMKFGFNFGENIDEVIDLENIHNIELSDLFMLDEDEIGVIKRLSSSGQVIKTSLDDKENIIKKIDEFTKKEIKYDFNTEYSYFSENQLSELNDDVTIGKTKVAGVYKKLFVNKYDEPALKVYLGKLNFKTNQVLPNIDLDKQNVVVTVSRYEINNITKNIGNIKYDLGKFSDKYIVNLYIVSKVVNVNCIYFNNSDDPMVETFSTTNKENGIEYYVQNEKYYANINNKKTELISLKQAANIADKEAQKSKYQYQEWKSEFYTRDSDLDEYGISGELILGLDTISKFSHWRDEWQNEEYEDKVMWKIRLFDRNDPLTNLYIYIDALNGNIIGAGAASD